MTHNTALGDTTGLQRTDANRRAQLSAMMFLQYFMQGCYLPVITVYLRSGLGFSATEVGAFGAAFAVGPMVAPFIIGQLVDRHFATQRVLAFCHFAGGLLMLALYMQTNFWPVILLGTAYSTLYVPTTMLTNTLAFRHLANREREFPRIRLWGTIGFVIPAWLVELYFLKGLEGESLQRARAIILALSGGTGLVMGLYCLTLPNTPPNRDERLPFAPGKILSMLTTRNFLVLVLVSFVIAIAHQYFFLWNSPYLKAILERSGIADAWEQRISSLGQIFEVVVMIWLGFMVQRLGFKITMLIGAAAYILRFLIFAVAISTPESTPVPPVLALVCVGEALHGVCFACFLAVAYMYVDRISPSDARGTMQTFYGTLVLALGGFVGSILGGAIGESFETASASDSLRARAGIASNAGMVVLNRIESGEATSAIVDWAGIWLAGAAMAAIAFVAFALFFPSDRKTTPSSN